MAAVWTQRYRELGQARKILRDGELISDGDSVVNRRQAIELGGAQEVQSRRLVELAKIRIYVAVMQAEQSGRPQQMRVTNGQCMRPVFQRLRVGRQRLRLGLGRIGVIESPEQGVI